eukprot:gb/GECH01010999.1/.p1 GENE.gb/GECH01010999.1/~~gb/GECH01010999.1/.p1  ORF type:complete len:1091 (+),score=312.68 gb/GECH01010999.1/:1-3273(+)
MSAINLEDIEPVLQSLLSSNNQEREKAEQYYNNLRQNPDHLVTSLVAVLQSSQDITLRQLSCVLVRRLLSATSPESLYNNLSAEAKQFVKTRLVDVLENEEFEPIRKKLTHVVSALAAVLVSNNELSEFFPTLIKWAQGPNQGQQLSALNIFSSLATYLMDEGLQPYMNQLRQIFEQCLESDSSKVRVAALEATTAIITSVEKNFARSLTDLTQPMLQTIAQALNDQHFEGAETAIERFIDISESQYHFFKPQVVQVIDAMFTIAASDQLQESIRHLAIEFMITLSETAPGMVRRVDEFIDNVFPLFMHMMLDIEEDSEWAETPEDYEDTDLTNYEVGLEALDRIAIALGGDLVQPIAFKHIPEFLNNEDWKHKHAGLMAISQTAEGCVAQYEEHLSHIVNMVLKMFSDQHPRVRFAAIHCIAQLSTDFSPAFQAAFHGMVVPTIINAMDDDVPKVQGHAATAIVNFVEPCQNEFIEPYLESLLSKLIFLLQNGKHFVQEQALSAISAVASASEGLFSKYYTRIMPLLMNILENALQKHERLLRARAMECATLIAVAVKKEQLGDDANTILNMLHSIQQTQLDPDDPMVNYLLQAWGRMAKVLGRDFQPYLKIVIPPLLQSADVKPEVVISDADEEQNEQEEGMESMTLSIKGYGDKRISIRTSALEDKSISCNMLYTYVRELQSAFFEYVDDTAKVMVPLLKFAYLDEIRETAASIMSELVSATRNAIEEGKANPQLLKQLVDYICGTFFEALKNEPEYKTGSILAEGLNEMLDAAKVSVLSAEQLHGLTQVFHSVLVRCLDKRQEHYKEMKEAEDENEKELIDSENSLVEENIFAIEECITTVMKTNYDDFIELYVAHLWPIFTQMLNSQLPDTEHRLALCMLCDFVEHGRGRAEEFIQDIVRAFTSYAKSQDPSVRQPAVYGLGVCAEHSGEYFNSVVQEVVNTLHSIVTEEDANSHDKGAATANAVSAIYKIARYRSNHVNVAEVMSIWLKSLPVHVDLIEAKIVHKNLLMHTRDFDSLVVGENKENLPFIVKVFAQIAGSELVDPEDHQGIISFLQQLNNEGHLEQCTRELDNELQQRLHNLLSS